MPNNTSVKANKINVKDLVYCTLTSDTSSAVTYGSVKPLAKAMQVQITPGTATGVLYGDGAQEENMAKLTELSVVIDVNKVAIEDKAIIQGNTYQNGILLEKKTDEAPYIAVGFKVEQTNSKYEYVWLLKGRAQPMNESVQQATDNINFSTDSITINFIARDYDGMFRYYGDTANADFTAAQQSAFFTTGPVTPPAPTPVTT